jgi:hypothetical protein
MRPAAALLAAAVLLAPHAASAADSAQVRAAARMLVTKHTVGDNMRVLVETETPQGYEIDPPSEKADYAPFELKRVESSPIARGKNRVRRTFILHVTVFEKGSLTFPATVLRWRAPGGRSGEVKTEPFAVEIASVGRRPTDKDDIRTIKGPESFDPRRFWSMVAAILAGLLAVVLAVKITWRRLRRSPDDESLKPPHTRARLELERLKDADLVPAGRARDHAAGVADVLRRYIERRFGVEAMEKTTAELADSMRAKGLDRTLIDKVRALLERVDLIKFAKEEPSRPELDAAERVVLALVDETTPKTAEPGTKPA